MTEPSSPAAGGRVIRRILEMTKVPLVWSVLFLQPACSAATEDESPLACDDAAVRLRWDEAAASVSSRLDLDAQGQTRAEAIAGLLIDDQPFLYANADPGLGENPVPASIELIRDPERAARLIRRMEFDECGVGWCMQLLSHRAEHYLFKLDPESGLHIIGLFERSNGTYMGPTANWKNVRVLHDALIAAVRALYGDIAMVRCGIGLDDELATAGVGSGPVAGLSEPGPE